MKLEASHLSTLVAILIGSLTVFKSPLAKAIEDGACWSGNTNTYTLSRSVSIGQKNLSTESYSGKGFTAQCYCSAAKAAAGKQVYWYQAVSSLPVDSDGYLILSPELRAIVRMKVYNIPDPTVPFTYAGTTTENCKEGTNGVSFSASGNLASVHLESRGGGLLGRARYSGLVASLYAAWGGKPYTGGEPFTQVYMDLDIQAAANCTFNAGSQLTLDLNSVRSGSLRENAPPVGYTPRSLDLSVNCTGIPEGYTSGLKYFFDGIRATPRFVQSTLPSIGIGIQDENEKPILLGAENSINVPYVNNGTSFRPRFFPVLLPGKPIQHGDYSASIIVTVSTP